MNPVRYVPAIVRALAVELASIVSGARTMARFMAGFYTAGGLR